MSDDLLKWVVTNLFGYQPPIEGDRLFHNHYNTDGTVGGMRRCDEVHREFQSWHGIGLVIEAMEKRGVTEVSCVVCFSRGFTRVRFVCPGKSIKQLELHEGKSTSVEPWWAWFLAARRAMEGEG